MARYDRGYRRGYRMAPAPWGGYYPPTNYGGGPWYGLAGGGWAPYAPFGPRGADLGMWYGYEYTPRRPPQESPSYGRGGDRELQRWARSHGYDVGYEIRPRSSAPTPRRRGYSRDYRRERR